MAWTKSIRRLRFLIDGRRQPLFPPLRQSPAPPSSPPPYDCPPAAAAAVLLSLRALIDSVICQPLLWRLRFICIRDSRRVIWKCQVSSHHKSTAFSQTGTLCFFFFYTLDSFFFFFYVLSRGLFLTITINHYQYKHLGILHYFFLNMLKYFR